jgi:5-methyltetrahydrofolate--homocysteine methyltransferase
MIHVAREMERQQFKVPLLIGGATTSRAHTAVKIAQHYTEPVVHVLDASRAVPVVTSLISTDSRAAFDARNRDEQARLRAQHSGQTQAMISLEEARANRTRIEWRAEDIAEPEFTGVRVLTDFPLATLRDYIDWSPFFHPKILEHNKYGEQARKLFADAQELLDRIIAEKLISANAVYGIFPANADGDDIELYTNERRQHVLTRFHFLRQQMAKEPGEPHRSLADFVAPKFVAAAYDRRTSAGEGGAERKDGDGHRPPLQDHLGAFAVTTGVGLKELVEQFKATHDDYNAIMAEALADRLAEAFAECLHKRVRADWGFGESEQLTAADLIEEKYRGIRPAAGYPACPDHTEKGTLWNLLDVEKNAGIQLTESFAMWPGSSVSGLYFAHPQARYFGLGRIDRDQVLDYHLRKGMTVQEVERWLAPNLNYDATPSAAPGCACGVPH